MESYIKTAIIDNEIEALWLGAVLAERQIPHQMTSYHDTAYDGLFQTQKGWGHVSAPPAYRDMILEIISDLRTGAGKH
jgi:hypothetical protein